MFSEISKVISPVAVRPDFLDREQIKATTSRYRSHHEFTGPEPLAYKRPSKDAGNDLKVAKKLAAYGENAELSVTLLLGLKICNARVGATGACLSVHHAYCCNIRSVLSPFAQPISLK